MVKVIHCGNQDWVHGNNERELRQYMLTGQVDREDYYFTYAEREAATDLHFEIGASTRSEFSIIWDVQFMDNGYIAYIPELFYTSGLSADFTEWLANQCELLIEFDEQS